MKPDRALSRRKRAFDLIVGSILFVTSLPIQGVVALLIRCTLGSPVLFRQVRPGRNGEPFEFVKFRTMRDSDAAGLDRPDAERLTRLGRRLRSLSLDELPTLGHVITGRMSLVGPRPLLVAYLDRYTAEQNRRHEVLPGLTGLAQVSGRNSLSWEDRLALDVEYVDSGRFTLDVKILAITVLTVLGRRGISEDGSATMTEFKGIGNAS